MRRNAMTMSLGRPSLDQERIIAADKTAHVTVKLPTSLKQDLANEAEREGMNLSAYVRSILVNRGVGCK